MRPWASVGLSHSSRSSSLDASRGTRLSRRSALTSASPHCSEAAEKRKSLGWNLLACRLGGSSPALRNGRTARQSLARDRVAFDRRGAAAVATGQTLDAHQNGPGIAQKIWTQQVRRVEYGAQVS